MSVLLAVDCSLVTPGAALFVDGVLRRAARVRIKGAPEDRADRCRYVAQDIRAWARAIQHHIAPQHDMSELVLEWPQIYRASKSKGDPNDLIGIAGVAAALAALLPSARVRSPTPAEWIGQVPKSTSGDPWSSPRGGRIAARLSMAEISVVEPSHDAIDAVGLGLWALGRLDRKRVFPGAT